MEETIPEPTRLEVQKALADTWRAWGGWPAVESGMINMTGVLADRMIELFASAKDRAIIAERERCAKIAAPVTGPGGTDYEKQAYDIRDVIATSIRSGV